ncbi:FUSC family membrane protein, partial [Pseudomonas aeruginosa]
MPPSSLTHTLRRLWALDKFAYSLRVFIALAGALLLCWWQDRIELLIPLFLGIIASALAETDDNWLGRLQALLVTLLCFSVAAFAVELLFPYPWLFVSGMALSAFGMILLGALGERYAAIASATLILSIYTMIGVDQSGGEVADVWHYPLLL